MKTIIPAADNVIKLLGKAKTGENYRLMYYVVSEDVEDGVLIFHTLTREMLLLSKEEYSRLFELPELYEKWFIVPEKTNDMKLVDQIRFTLRAMQKKSEYITNYTIFTTTDCNARCFYCFEKGAKRYPMSEETALKTAEFIEKHCGGKPVKLAWFGGEPLYNTKAIDIISNALKEKKINFSSHMTTNGYLLDDEIINRAKKIWNLQMVQITLDGTEKTYNQTKNYIYDDTNPFETVLGNIEKCLKNEIYVQIRLNLSSSNADDLTELVHQLYQRFGKNKYLLIYSMMLYQIKYEAEDVFFRVQEKKKQLDNIIEHYNFRSQDYLNKHLKLTRCQADCDTCATVLPNGKLGACEHYTDSYFIGDVWSDTIDINARKEFKECEPPIAECSSCFYYPECIRLKKCEAVAICKRINQAYLISHTRSMMKNTFYRKEASGEESDENNC